MDNGLTPFIELGEKPIKVNMTLKERIRTWSHYKFMSSLDYKIVDFLTIFIRHCIAKWGKSVVSKWQFEFWYPSRTIVTSELQDFEKKQDVNKYLQKFDIVYSSIKALLPEALVGGCELSVDIDYHNIDLILNEWKTHHLPDFFSVSIYAQNILIESNSLKVKNSLSNDPNLMQKMITNTKRALQKNGLDTIPLYVTEWNISISDRNFLHDSLFQAAYIIRNILSCFNQVDIIAYWQLSDIPGASSDVKGILHGGVGLLTKDSIAKPAYYAFKLLRLATGKVNYQQDNMLITTRGEDKINVLVDNYSHFNGVYYLNKENAVDPRHINSIFENTASRTGAISLDGIAAGNYLVKTWYLTAHDGNVFTTWLDWGMPDSLGNDEIRYLESKTGPRLKIQNMALAHHTLQLDYDLDVNATVLFEIYKEP